MGVDVDEAGIVVVGGAVDADVAVVGDSEPSCHSVRTLFWCHAIWTRIGGGMFCWLTIWRMRPFHDTLAYVLLHSKRVMYAAIHPNLL